MVSFFIDNPKEQKNIRELIDKPKQQRFPKKIIKLFS